MRRRTLLLPLAAVAVLLVVAGSLALLLHPSGGTRPSVGSGKVAGPPFHAGAAPGAAAQPASGGSGPTTPGPRVQRSARLSLDVDRGQLDGRIDRVLQLVSAQGGFVAGVQPAPVPADDASARSGQVTFQVPAAKFDDTLVALRRMGTTTNIQMSGIDVSGQYVDVQARLANARAQRDAYLALLGRAQSVQEIIAVQDKLGAVTGQIEEYQGQLDALNQTTTYGTITVSISERAALAQGGFGQAFSQAGSNLVAVLQFLVVAVGTLAPFLVVAGVGLGGWWLWSRRRRQAPAGR